MAESGEAISPLSFDLFLNQLCNKGIIAFKACMQTAKAKLVINLVKQGFGWATVIADCTDLDFHIRSFSHVQLTAKHTVMLNQSSFTYNDLDRKVTMRPFDSTDHQVKEVPKDNVFVNFRVISMKHYSARETFSYG